MSAEYFDRTSLGLATGPDYPTMRIAQRVIQPDMETHHFQPERFVGYIWFSPPGHSIRFSFFVQPDVSVSSTPRLRSFKNFFKSES